MSMDYIGYAIVGVMVILLIWVTFGSSKVKWFKVYLANNDVLLLKRDLRERWWRTSDRYMRFKNENNREITFPSNAHWVLMWEEVPIAELELIKDEILKNRARIIAEREQ
jgi:hypothetical protein